jgi:NAD+-dependent protein deacetylase sirtuin 2
MEKIAHFFADKLHLTSSTEDDDEADGRHVLQSVDIAGIVSAFKAGKFKKIVTMVGAGIR